MRIFKLCLLSMIISLSSCVSLPSPPQETEAATSKKEHSLQQLQLRIKNLEQQLRNQQIVWENANENQHQELRTLQNRISLLETQTFNRSQSSKRQTSRPSGKKPKPQRPTQSRHQKASLLPMKTSKPQTVAIAQAMPPSKPTPSTTAHSKENEKKAYTEAFLALKDGHYQQAIKGFTKCLKDFPQGEHRNLNQFWLAEAYNATGQLAQAIEHFQHVENQGPHQDKHAKALWRIANLSLKLQHQQQAIETMKTLIELHPQSHEAQRARQLLASSS